MTSRLTGQSIERVEDARMLVGQGRFVAGLRRPGALEAVFVRSPLAHARITAVETSDAAKAAGVVAVLTGDVVAAAMTGPMAVFGPPTLHTAPFWPLARDAVRFVGDPVALVVAETAAQAADAAELVAVSYDPLPPVVRADQALDPTVPPLFPELGTNVLHRDARSFGRPFDDLAAEADRVVRRRYVQHRYGHAPIEGRGAIAEWNPSTGRFDYDMANKRPHALKLSLSGLLGIPFPDVHVRSCDIGGAFGSKGQTTREDVALAVAAKLLGRAVRWVEDRTENLQAAGQAREETVDVEAAVTADGRVLALRAAIVIDTGAYPMLPFPPTMFALLVSTLMPNALRLEGYEVSSTVVASNKASYIAYRAPWVMETIVRERLLDDIAVELGLAPDEIRRRNLLTTADQPTTMITGPSIDDVSVRECLDRAVELAELPAFRAAQERARAEGRHLGIGMSTFIENAPGPPDFAPTVGFDLPGEVAWARIEPTGDLVVTTSQVPHGQGHETTLAQVAADELGVPMARVRIVWGASDHTPFSTMSTGGSRAATLGAGAAKMATRAVKEQVLQIAAHVLEANPLDLEIDDGRIAVRGTPAKAITVADVARMAFFAPSKLPAGMGSGLDGTAEFKPPAGTGWVSACHVCWVEVDVETGLVTIPRYLVVEDCGELINPAIVDGQIRGGVAQGIASVLLERHVYDDDGQLLTSSFADYLVPAACDVPAIEVVHVHRPSRHEVPWRGVGEGGLLGAPAAVLNAIADALAPFGVAVAETHLPPARVRALVTGG
jgi:aerobic carbon-monoxide dehydrogenase large subunit